MGEVEEENYAKTNQQKQSNKKDTNKRKDMLRCAAGPKSRFEWLSHAYKCLQNEARPAVSAGTLAATIFAGAAEVSAEDGESGSGGSVELTYLSLTLVRKIASSLTARNLPPGVASYFAEVLKKIIDEMDLMSHLVRSSLLVKSKTYAIIITHQDLFHPL